MVDLMGVEPTTFRLQGGCSPKLSYRPIFRTFNQPLLINFMVTAASLNLCRFCLLGNLHAVHPGLCSLVLRVIGPLHYLCANGNIGFCLT